MSSFSRNVPLLAAGQALMITAMSVMVISSTFVGEMLASNQNLKTLPVAALFIAITFTSIPAAMFMERFGRKTGFILASIIGISGASLATWAIIIKDFWLFVAGAVCMGIFNGFGNFFRFAAADAVDVDHKSRAIAYVLAGGIVAAVLGANLVKYLEHAVESARYAGGYAALIVAYILALINMAFLKLPPRESTVNDAAETARSLKTIISQPKYIVALVCGMFGYAVMSFIMTATPPAMKHHSGAMGEAVPFVILWHMVAMFAPSFFTGSLIKRFGVYSIMFIGAVFGLACVGINQAGESYWHYWTALVFLGLSWNFLFTGATSLLTETYHPSERGKAQAFNDFIVFAAVSVASLSAGALQHSYGWKIVNLGVLPLLGLIVLSLLWIKYRDRKTLAMAV